MQTTPELYTDNIQLIDLRTIDDELAPHLARFWNAIRAEYLPDDPPIPLQERIAGWHNLPAFEVNQVWALWNPAHTEIIATIETEYWLTEDNQHLVYFEISVAREQRCQGLARRLLAFATQVAQQNNKRLLITETCSNVPAGAAFMERLGAQRGMEARTNQVRIAEVDRELMARWQENLAGRYAPFELGLWVGAYPQEQIQGVLELFKITRDEPHDDLDIEERIIDEAQIRQMEQYNQARGVERWTFYLTEKATGRFCGFTEVFWNPNLPDIVQQGFTGVNPDFRGKNLGRYLKAVMFDKIVRDRPAAAIIRTGNANSNKFMLAINNEMGFRPYIAWTYWQIPTDQVLAYLAG